MVRDSLLIGIKRIAVPFGVVSTASLFTVFNTAHAETVTSSKTVTDYIFQRKGLLLHDTEGKGIIGGTKQVWHNIEWISEKIVFALDWLNNLPISIPKYSADLLTLIYNFLSDIALKTPLFLFNNPALQNTSLVFSLVSISIVTILTVFEAFMQMFKKEHTDLKTIVKRWAIIASVTGFLPHIFEMSFDWLNKLSDAISNIGSVNGGNANGFISGKRMGFFDTLIIILFDITAISMLIPFALQAGKRWFDLACLAAISPLALSSWIFDRHRHYYYKWWNEVKSLSIIQVVQAVFILILGVFVFSTQAIQGGILVIISKLVIMIAGIHRMVNPPRIVTALAGGKEDAFDVYDDYKRTFNNIKDTVTLQKFRPANFVRDMIAKNKENKMKKKYGVRHLDVDKIETNLRKKHGRRYVKDLL
jgi:hypothetical protein